MTSPSLRVTSTPLPEVPASMLIVPVFEQDPLDDVLPLDQAAQGDVTRALSAGELKAKLGDVHLVSLRGWRAPRALLVGAGIRADWTHDRLRRLATAGALAARARGAGDVALLLRADDQHAEAVGCAAEGLVMAAFDGDNYKTAPRDSAALVGLQIIVRRDDAGRSAAAARGRVLGECTNLARGLSNEPANRLSPRVFADRAAAAVDGTNVSLDVLDEERIRGLGMGLLLGVAQGSAEPPCLMVLRYGATDRPDAPVLGLVGKGITFDTGGISIKPADGMDRMKTDMSGGAATVAAMRAIGLLGAPVAVVGVVPAAENMLGPRATRPGDVLTSASGATVEVNNTDAEGRLLLGDALWYARQLGATHLVDVATLTGSCAVALGRHVSGLFGSDEAWVETVRRAAGRAGDRVWPLPIYEEALEQMRSEIADLINAGGRYGGACTAAAFLREFTGGRPWAHLDIAGTAWADEAKPWQPKGATGVAVRTLAELALGAEEWRPRGPAMPA